MALASLQAAAQGPALATPQTSASVGADQEGLTDFGSNDAMQEALRAGGVTPESLERVVYMAAEAKVHLLDPMRAASANSAEIASTMLLFAVNELRLAESLASVSPEDGASARRSGLQSAVGPLQQLGLAMDVAPNAAMMAQFELSRVIDALAG